MNVLSKLGMAVAASALAFAVLVLPAAAHRTAEVTVFKGRFVCNGVPLAGAAVYLDTAEQLGSSGFLGLGSTGDVFGVRGLQHAITGPDGDFRFEVPFSSDNNQNYQVRVTLDDGQGLVVRDWPSTAPVEFSTGTNQNDVPEQDYGTQPFPGPECAVWLGLRAAALDYAQLMGQTFGGVTVDYGGPNEGVPWTAFRTVEWPVGYPVGADLAHPTAAFHQFAHAIRDQALGPDHWLDDLSAFNFKQQLDPCTRSGPALALYEGFAEFWAGDYGPAPNCPGVSPTDQSVEGMVAWRLLSMERFCPDDSRRQMVTTLLQAGTAIHSLLDLQTRLPRCDGGLLDPSQASGLHAPTVAADRYAQDIRSLAHRATSRAAAIGAQLADARRAAESAGCPPFPCTKALAARIAPAILAGELAQEKLVAKTLDTQLTTPAATPTQSLVASVLTTPTRLTRALGAIDAASVANALAAARPFAAHDRSSRTRKLVTELQRLGHDDTLVARSGNAAGSGGLVDVYLQLGSVGGTKRAHSVKLTHRLTHHVLVFGGLPTGVAITSQLAGATFGSAQAIGFPGSVPAHVCPAPPTAQHAGPALAPTCPAGAAGYITAGTMAKLAAPAAVVGVQVGTTLAVPGGFAADLDAFDSNGNLIGQDAALVGSATNGGTAGLTQTVRVEVGKNRIAFIALFFDASWTSGTDLIFDDLTTTGV